MQDLTTGPIARHLLRTSGFMLVTMVFQTLYFLVDLYWVGRLGKEAVAGVGIAGNLTFVVLAVSQMLGVGITTLISHASGRKDRERAGLVFNQSQGLSAIVAAVFLVLAWTLRQPYARALAADEATATVALDYLRWFIPAMALQFGLVGMSAALRGSGNFKPGMIVQTTTVVINLVLAPTLMFGWLGGPPMGVAGTALASLVAVGVGTAWLARYFLAPDAFLKFNREQWWPQLDVWKGILRIGLPAGAEFAFMGVYLLVVYAITRPFGAEAQAGFGIGFRLVQSGFMPVVALGFAVAPVAGQNFGAGHITRVRETFKAGATMAACGAAIFALAAHYFAPQMMGVFTADPRVVSVGNEYLWVIAWTFVASGVVFVTSSMFQALGNAVPALISSFIRLVLVTLPAFLLVRAPGFELWWLWYLSAAGTLLQLCLNLWFLQRAFSRLATMPARRADAPDASPIIVAGDIGG